MANNVEPNITLPYFELLLGKSDMGMSVMWVSQINIYFYCSMYKVQMFTYKAITIRNAQYKAEYKFNNVIPQCNLTM